MQKLPITFNVCPLWRKTKEDFLSEIQRHINAGKLQSKMLGSTLPQYEVQLAKMLLPNLISVTKVYNNRGLSIVSIVCPLHTAALPK